MKQGLKCAQRHKGIYTIEGIAFLRVQVVVTEELDSDIFAWLSALTNKLTESKAKSVVNTAKAYTDNDSKRLAEAVLRVLLSANEDVFDRIREDIDMTLMEFLKPEVDKKIEEERNLITQIVAELTAGKDDNTIASELNCSIEQIIPLRAAMGK